MGEKENKNVEEILEKVFENVNNWLNFAEAKNAANIALVVAIIAAIVSLELINVYIVILLLLFIASGIISLLTFVPKLGAVFMNLKKTERENEPNLLYFGDIYTYSGEEYLCLVYKEYNKNEKTKYSKYEKDLANEIVYNSAVTMMKYNYFKIAVKVDIVAFVILAVGFIIA